MKTQISLITSLIIIFNIFIQNISLYAQSNTYKQIFHHAHKNHEIRSIDLLRERITLDVNLAFSYLNKNLNAVKNGTQPPYLAKDFSYLQSEVEYNFVDFYAYYKPNTPQEGGTNFVHKYFSNYPEGGIKFKFLEDMALALQNKTPRPTFYSLQSTADMFMEENLLSKVELVSKQLASVLLEGYKNSIDVTNIPLDGVPYEIVLKKLLEYDARVIQQKHEIIMTPQGKINATKGNIVLTNAFGAQQVLQKEDFETTYKIQNNGKYIETTPTVKAWKILIPFKINIPGAENTLNFNGGDILLENQNGTRSAISKQEFNNRFTTIDGQKPNMRNAALDTNLIKGAIKLNINRSLQAIARATEEVFNMAVKNVLKTSSLDTAQIMASTIKTALQYEELLVSEKNIIQKTIELNKQKVRPGEDGYSKYITKRNKLRAAKKAVENEQNAIKNSLSSKKTKTSIKKITAEIINNTEIPFELRARVASLPNITSNSGKVNIGGPLFSVLLIGGFELIISANTNAAQNADLTKSAINTAAARMENEKYYTDFVNEYPDLIFLVPEETRNELLQREDASVPDQAELLAGLINKRIAFTLMQDENSVLYTILQKELANIENKNAEKIKAGLGQKYTAAQDKIKAQKNMPIERLPLKK